MGGDWSIVSSKTRAKMNKTVGKTNSGELWWSKEENRLFSVRQVSALVNKTSTDLLHAFLFDEICTVYCGQLKPLFSRRLKKGNRPNFVFVPSLYSLWIFIVMELWMLFLLHAACWRYVNVFFLHVCLPPSSAPTICPWVSEDGLPSKVLCRLADDFFHFISFFFSISLTL